MKITVSSEAWEVIRKVSITSGDSWPVVKNGRGYEVELDEESVRRLKNAQKANETLSEVIVRLGREYEQD